MSARLRLQQIAERGAAAERLAAAHRDRGRLRILLERGDVAHLDRILRPVGSELLQRAGDLLGLLQVPQRVELRHHLDAIADRLADLAPGRQPELQIRPGEQAARRALGQRIERPDLHRAEALGQQALGQLVGALGEGDLVIIGTLRAVVRADLPARDRAGVVVVARAGVVGADAIAARPAQQLMDRLLHRLAEDVPQGEIDHRRRAHLGAGAGEAQVAVHQLAIVQLDRQRVLAQQVRRDQVVDLRLHRQRAARGLPQSHQPCVGVDLSQQQIGPARQPDGLDGADLHSCSAWRSRLRASPGQRSGSSDTATTRYAGRYAVRYACEWRTTG